LLRAAAAVRTAAVEVMVVEEARVMVREGVMEAAARAEGQGGWIWRLQR
jgi:hypothetical protein